MVGAVKKEAGTTGDGAELSDNQPVMIDWIMVQYIVLLKISGIICKIVIHGIISHDNTGISDYIFQINRFPILRAWVNFLSIKTLQHEQTKLIYELGVGKQESEARLVASHQQNDKLVQENATLRLKLEEQTREGKRKVLSRRIEDLKKSISSAETRLQQLKNIFEFDKTQIAPAARKFLVILFITCGLFIIVGIKLFSEPLYQLIENSSYGEKDVLAFASSGIVGALALLVYYVGVILIWGTPYTPAKLFCFLRDKLVRRKRIAYVLSNHYPSEYVDINLEAQIQQEERELAEVRKKLEEIEAGLRDL